LILALSSYQTAFITADRLYINLHDIGFLSFIQFMISYIMFLVYWYRIWHMMKYMTEYNTSPLGDVNIDDLTSVSFPYSIE